jgi:hypothetical protein
VAVPVVVTELLEQVVVVAIKWVVLAAAMAEQAALLGHRIQFKVEAAAAQVAIVEQAVLVGMKLLQLVVEARELVQVEAAAVEGLAHLVVQVGAGLAYWVKAVLVPRGQTTNLVAAHIGAMVAVVVAAVVVLVVHVPVTEQPMELDMEAAELDLQERALTRDLGLQVQFVSSGESAVAGLQLT